MTLGHMFLSTSNDLKQIYKYRYVISSFVETNLRVRYRRSFLGFFWTIIAPLIHYLIIAFVFKYASSTSDNDYFLYFFSGAVIFNAFSITLLRAPNIMLANEMYIKKIYLPKFTYILNTCFYEFTNFLLSSAALLGLGIVLGVVHLSWSLLVIPPLLLALLLTLIGFSAILSVGGVYFRDLAYIISPIMQASFFLTPIVYKIETFPQKFQHLLRLNPIYHMIQSIRVPLMAGELAPQIHYWIVLGVAVFVLLFGYWTVKHFDNRIIFKL